MIYVMSDIHGHRRRFDSVMKQISPRIPSISWAM